MTAGAFLFAVMAELAHALGTRCDWLNIALVRVSFVFVVAVVAARAAGAQLVLWRPRTLWMRSLAGSFSLVCSFYAMTRLPVSEALTLSNTYPLWIVVLSWLTLRRKPAGGDALRVLCAVVGVALIEQPHLTGNRLAVAVALLGSVSTAVAMIGLHRLREVDTRAVVAHFAGVGSLFAGTWFVLRGGLSSLAPAPAVETPTSFAAIAPIGRALASLAQTEPRTWLLLLGVCVAGTIGQFFLTKAYAAGAPARVAVLGLSQVVFGLGFDTLFNERALTLASVAGTFLVLAPTAWLVLRAGVTSPADPSGSS
jgi:drug/metabolite transporter (DMT)-like permease